jgi:hypothetical protein
MNETVIVIMAKQPQAGKTKTRLYPLISPQQAADLYQALLLDTIVLAADQTWTDLALAITPLDSRPYFETITPAGTLLLPVDGADIGACLAKALQLAFEKGYRKALALNSDGPSLPAMYLRQAKRSLLQADLVLGPGEDGGYYLVGMKQLYPKLFEGIAWSTEKVLAQTMERAASQGLRTDLTQAWYDVDTPADLLRLQAEIESLPVNRLQHTRRFLAGVDLKT